jgi:transposase
MSPSPITIGVGNGARTRPIPITPAQGVTPPAQGQPAQARQAELVICDQTIERLINRLKQNRRIATRYEKRGVNYAAMLTIGMIRLWL